MMSCMSNMAVEVVDVSFAYGNTNVLTGVNLNVPKGQIYALLGPSGSGKTSLLRLILGRIKLRMGTIKVFGSIEPGYFNRIIGYMPQNEALCLELTVGETLDYFASIYQLERKQYHKEKESLGRLLQLAEDNHLVGELSGGQQKALSLALVFLHKPKMVILDEPTVGTDPVLGNQIWSYLQELCTQGLSVIIVTHYIQEASQADHVGMMRSGQIIEEGTPREMYNKYSDTSLERIFIKICTDRTTHLAARKNMDNRVACFQRNINDFLSYENGTDLVNKNTSRGKFSKKNSAQMQLDTNLSQVSKGSYSTFWMLFILVRRNVQMFLNSKLTGLMLFSPIFCTLLMCITFKVSKINLNVSVINEDYGGPYSVDMQNITKQFGVHVVNYRQVNSLQAAIDTVRRGHALAALHFDHTFSDTLKLRLLPPKVEKAEFAGESDYEGGEGNEVTTVANTNLNETSKEEDGEITTLASTLLELTTTSKLMDKLNRTRRLAAEETTTEMGMESDGEKEEEEDAEEDETKEEAAEEYRVDGNYVHLSPALLNASTMKLYIDNSNFFFAQPLLDILSYGSWELSNKVLRDHNLYPFASPVTVAEVVYARDTDTSDFLLSGYMVAFLYLSQVTLCSQLLILEKQNGFFDRAIVAGAKHSLMFVSHFITNFAFSIVQIAAMFLIGFVWYSIPNFGSYWLAFTLIIFQSASSIMTGLLISALCKENFSAFFVSLAITMSQLFSSGAIFPIISFDPFMKLMLLLTPIAMPVQSLRNVMLRGWDMSNLEVAQGLMANIVTTTLFGLLALFLFVKYS